MKIEAPRSVRHLIEFRKTGRIFYACDSGRVNEVQFSGSFWNIKSVFESKKSVQVVDRQKESFYMKLIPEVLKIRFSKEIIQLKIDEQRNLLYSLGVVTEGKGSG